MSGGLVEEETRSGYEPVSHDKLKLDLLANLQNGILESIPLAAFLILAEPSGREYVPVEEAPQTGSGLYSFLLVAGKAVTLIGPGGVVIHGTLGCSGY